METKRWYESRILWAQILAIVVVAAEVLFQVKPDADVVRQMETALPAIIAIVTIFLRFRTDQPIQ